MSKIELSDMIVGLRQELMEAQKKAEQEDLQFRVDAVEIEAQVTVTEELTGGVKTGFKFWIFGEAEAEVGGTKANAQVQTIRLKLTPAQSGKSAFISGDGDFKKKKKGKSKS